MPAGIIGSMANRGDKYQTFIIDQQAAVFALYNFGCRYSSVDWGGQIFDHIRQHLQAVVSLARMNPE